MTQEDLQIIPQEGMEMEGSIKILISFWKPSLTYR